MNQYIEKYLKRLKEYYTGLNNRQKRNVWLIGFFFLATVIALAIFFMNPNYEVVFSNLDAKSAGQITQQLDQQKIPYELQGSNILVPASMADKVRVEMAMDGLPSTGNVDYSSIFQQNNVFGMTSQELNLQVLNVLEARLAQSISSINGIENAQVNIVMPVDTSFLVQPSTGEAKASVLLQVAPGYVLSSQQVFGIQQLVAHAVQGLSADNVSVVDQNGNDLTNNASGAGGSLGLTGGQLSGELGIRQSVEQNLASEIKASLSNIVGANNVAVVVHANMTFNSVEEQQRKVKAGPPLSTQSSSSTTTGASGGGVAGQSSTNPNLPNYGTGGSGSGGSSSNRSTTTNYDNNVTNTTTQFDPVQINGYTVSVLINSNAIKMTPQLTSNIKSYVETAIGQAGNATASNITVLPVPFNGQNVTLPASSWYSSPLLLGGLGALIAAGIVVWLLRSRRKPARFEHVLESASVSALAAPAPESPEAILTNELKDLATRRPDAFASLLRTWLSEE